MQEHDGLEQLQGLHRDLIAFSQGQLRNVERLWAELDARVDEFKQLLDRPNKNESSRKALSDGVIDSGDDKYAINVEFRENAIQLADILDLDEVVSARLLLDVQQSSESFDRPIITTAIVNFHQRQESLLECLRLTLAISLDSDVPSDARNASRGILGLIIGVGETALRDGPAFVHKCLQAMVDIEQRLQMMVQRTHGVLAMNHASDQFLDELDAHQQQSLNQQHESLSGIVALLVKSSYSSGQNFQYLVDHVSRIDRWGSTTIHYAPILLAHVTQHGSPDGISSLREARSLHDKIMNSKDYSAWALQYYQAALQAWWLAEYSGWYQEAQGGSPLQAVDIEAEAVARSTAFFDSLRDGAFECILTICTSLMTFDGEDPAKSSLASFLLRETVLPQHESLSASDWFVGLFMEQLEAFVDALITNMPDTLRQFKYEEDDQRKRIYSNLQNENRNGFTGQDFHLERFLLIISFSFDGRTDAAQSFWADNDSNLHGFLQWASKRQSTPCVSAFCELLHSISENEECANAAHRFLLDDGGGASSRYRKHGSLGWSQILGELLAFTTRIREPPKSRKSQVLVGGKPDVDDIDEPESVYMLESYIRLMSHLCTESLEARVWIWSQSDPPILDMLFTLCNSAVPGRLQACAFAMIRSLLTSKSVETAMAVWSAFDAWASGAYAPPNIPRLSKGSGPNSWLESVTFSNVTAGWDQANGFTLLLQALLLPSDSGDILRDRLAFPDNLGSSYRSAGVEPYVDLVLDKIFAGNLTLSEDPQKAHILNNNILGVIGVCLGTFNQDLLVIASKSNFPVDEAMSATNLATYLRLHPFSRTMEWLFNDRVLERLFQVTHEEPDQLAAARFNKVIPEILLRGVEVMLLLLELQSTYMNIIKPVINNQLSSYRQSPSNPSLATFEDSVALHLQFIADLALYAGIGDQPLACVSLKVLTKLTTSRRLRGPSEKAWKFAAHSKPLHGLMQRKEEMERIAGPLSHALEVYNREIEPGRGSPDMEIKLGILDFLANAISATPDSPTIAHAILGFSCRDQTVLVEPETPFAKGSAVFHAVIQLVVDYPDRIDENFQLSALNLRMMAMEVLTLLWKSPLTSTITLMELREADFLSRLLIREINIDMNTLWENQAAWEPDFSFGDSAIALQTFVRLRKAFYDYINTEIRFVHREGGPSIKDRTFSALLGLTLTPEGDQIPHCSILDLIDFADVQVNNIPTSPHLEYFADVKYQTLVVEKYSEDGSRYDQNLIEQVCNLKIGQLHRSGATQDPQAEQNAMDEAKDILLVTSATNNLKDIDLANQGAFAAWSKSVSLSVEMGSEGSDARLAFLLQSIQIVTPKMESLAFENDRRATCTAKLLSQMLHLLYRGSSQTVSGKPDEISDDRAFQVFRVAVRSIGAPGIDINLRETLFELCLSYLSHPSWGEDVSGNYSRDLHAVKAAGTHALEIMCDDILGAKYSTRLSALWLLNGFCVLAARKESSYVLDTLVRTNFLQILIESVENLPDELRDSTTEDIPTLLGLYEAKFTLLLIITQSKIGAGYILKAGLLHAVRESGLFSVDPDIGIEIDNPDALAKYYRLLLFLTRTIVSAIISHGAQNTSTIKRGRDFIKDNRSLIVATLKRQAKIGGVSFDNAGIDIEELVELFISLIFVTGYLECDDTFKPSGRRIAGFS